MKYLLILCFLAASVHASVSDYDQAKRTQLITWVEQLRSKANEANSTATQALSDLADTGLKLKEAQANLSELTVQIKALVKERDDLQGQITVLQNEITRLSKEVAAEKAEAHRSAVERDVFIVLFSLVGTVIGMYSARFIIAAIPPPYSMLAWAGGAIAMFMGCYAGIRIVLAMIVGKL